MSERTIISMLVGGFDDYEMRSFDESRSNSRHGTVVSGPNDVTAAHSRRDVRIPVTLGADPLSTPALDPLPALQNPFVTPPPSCRSVTESVGNDVSENPFSTPPPNIAPSTTAASLHSSNDIPSNNDISVDINNEICDNNEILHSSDNDIAPPTSNDIARQHHLVAMLTHTRMHASPRPRSDSALPPAARFPPAWERQELPVAVAAPTHRPPPTNRPPPDDTEVDKDNTELYTMHDNVVERALRWIFDRPPMAWIVWLCVEGYWLPIFLLIVGSLTAAGAVYAYR